MLDYLGELVRTVGRKLDAASATGSLLAKMSELLTNRITTAKMANIDAAISGLVASSGGIVNSVQQGNFACNGSGTATISSVTTAKSELYHCGFSHNSGISAVPAQSYVVLTNSTTVTGTSERNMTVGFSVKEYK